MPTPLTANATNGATNPPVIAPTNLVDLATAASVIAGLQPLADRDAYLWQVLSSTGITHIAFCASLATLQAIDVTTIASGEIRFLYGVGLFRYESTATSAAITNIVVVPTVGAGRWINIEFSVWGTAYGLATLDLNGKLAQPAPNAIIAQSSAVSSATYDVTGTTFVDVAGMSVTLAANAGDVLHITFATPVLGAAGLIQLAVVEGGVTTPLGIYPTQATTAPAVFTYAGTFVHTVAGGSGSVVKLQARISGTGTTTVGGGSLNYGPATISVVQVRP